MTLLPKLTSMIGIAPKERFIEDFIGPKESLRIMASDEYWKVKFRWW